MFRSEIIERRVVVSPDEIRRNVADGDVDKSLLIDRILLKKIKNKLGDRCIEKGFVRSDSLEIVERSIGRIYAEHLNGDIVYDLRLCADICNPIKGEEVKGRVTNSNKMGLLVKSGPLNIVLARQHHVNRKCFRKINVGDEIPVSVVGSRFTFGDREISVIGYLGDVSDFIDEEDVSDEETTTTDATSLLSEDDDIDTESMASEIF